MGESGCFVGAARVDSDHLLFEEVVDVAWVVGTDNARVCRLRTSRAPSEWNIVEIGIDGTLTRVGFLGISDGVRQGDG
jgi:hypothetical protein